MDVMGTSIVPPAPRVVSPAIHEMVAADGALIAAGAVEVTQVMADSELKKSEDFEAAVARANSVLLSTLEPKDIMATMMLPSPAAKWAKLVEWVMLSVAHVHFRPYPEMFGGILGSLESVLPPGFS